MLPHRTRERQDRALVALMMEVYQVNRETAIRQVQDTRSYADRMKAGRAASAEAEERRLADIRAKDADVNRILALRSKVAA